jgi:hypothetical protein
VKYRKKPVVIDAEQWRGIYERGEMVTLEPPDGVIFVRRWYWPFSRVPVIRTLEGDLRVTPPRMDGINLINGSFVVTGVKGEKYAVRPDIFEATYEPA